MAEHTEGPRAKLSKNPGELASPPPACEGERDYAACVKELAVAVDCDYPEAYECDFTAILKKHFPRASQAERERDEAIDDAKHLLRKCLIYVEWIPLIGDIQAFLQGESRVQDYPTNAMHVPEESLRVERGNASIVPDSSPAKAETVAAEEAQAHAAVAPLPTAREEEIEETMAYRAKMNADIQAKLLGHVSGWKRLTIGKLLEDDSDTLRLELNAKDAELSALRQRVAEAGMKVVEARQLVRKVLFTYGLTRELNFFIDTTSEIEDRALAELPDDDEDDEGPAAAPQAQETSK